MATIRRFEDLDVWKTARDLTMAVYRLSRQGDFERDFGLRDQIQRASVSIMSNIAEGFQSRTSGPFVQFLGYARRSAAEGHSHLHVALDLEYITQEEFDAVYADADSCSRQIYGFICYLMSQSDNSAIEEPPANYQPPP